MKTNLLLAFMVLGLAVLVQACSIPPARLSYQTQPGKIQKVNCDPRSPYCVS